MQVQGSIKALVLTSVAIGAVIAALILAGNSLAASGSYCSNSEYWAASKDAGDYQDSAHDLYMADQPLDAYGEMLDAKYTISAASLPCHPSLRKMRTLELLTYATWATGYREAYLEHYSAALRAFKKVGKYLKQQQRLLRQVPSSAF